VFALVAMLMEAVPTTGVLMLLVPVVIGRAVQLPAAMLPLAMLDAGLVFGAGGVVLAAPVLAVAITVHDELTAEREEPNGP
jgi:predicted PurR-regulated permease PerM